MQNWLIAADEEKHDQEYYFNKYDGLIDWEQKFNFEVNDIVYIYSTFPIGRIKYKTIVEKTNMPIEDSLYPENFFGSDAKLVRYRLLEQVDKEELSYKKKKKNGLKSTLMSAKKLNGDLLHYIEKNFEGSPKKIQMLLAGENGFLYDEFKKRGIVAIGWGIGDVADLTKDEIFDLLKEKDEKGEKTDRGIYKNVGTIIRFRDNLEIGDYVLTTNPSRDKYLLGEITSDYYFSEELIEDKVDKKGKYNNLRNVKWLCEISSGELSEATMSYLGSSQTLFNINIEAIDEILSFYLGEHKWVDEKRNVIYFGAPGTGKSFQLNSDKDKLIFCKNEYERVTFHPDYSYANFVGTYKPRLKKR